MSTHEHLLCELKEMTVESSGAIACNDARRFVRTILTYQASVYSSPGTSECLNYLVEGFMCQSH